MTLPQMALRETEDLSHKLRRSNEDSDMHSGDPSIYETPTANEKCWANAQEWPNSHNQRVGIRCIHECFHGIFPSTGINVRIGNTFSINANGKEQLVGLAQARRRSR